MRLLSLPGDVLGGRALKLKLEPGSVILVTVENSPDSGLVQLWRGGRLLASAVLDDAGHAEFVDRGVGEYTVRLYGGTVAPQSVEVEQPGQAVADRGAAIPVKVLSVFGKLIFHW